MYIHAHEPDTLGAVVAPDTRSLVHDTRKPPYRWICALDLVLPKRTGTGTQHDRGTGFLISPRHVLTVAHNIRPTTGVEALSITVTPGQDGTNVLGKPKAPVGSLTVPAGSWWIPAGYTTPTDLAWDFALLELPEEFPLHGRMTYGHWSDARYAPATTIVAVRAGELVGTPIEVCGYPADKCGDKSCVPGCDTTKAALFAQAKQKKNWASMQWEAGGTVRPNPPAGLILYDADTCVGMSGAPLWQRKKRHDKDIFELVGIHGGMYTRMDPATKTQEILGRGVPIVAQLRDLLRQRVAAEITAPASKKAGSRGSTRLAPTF